MALIIPAAIAGLIQPPLARAEAAAELDQEVGVALERLYRTQPVARKLAQSAKAVLVFPHMVKAGFMFGGQIGEGAMRKGDLLRGGKTAGYYNSVSASYGLQAGLQQFGYAMFFMNDGALKALDQTSGFEVGVGPSVVLIDQGMAKTMTTTTLTQDVYAFIFDQTGLMAGLGIQGSKITRISK
jgi:lipid-binding SYLF domain-containing protein